MNTELLVIILLCILIVFQHVFYMRQIHKFTDKLMSGSYTNYVQNQAIVAEANKPGKSYSVQLPQDEGMSDLDELNMRLSAPF